MFDINDLFKNQQPCDNEHKQIFKKDLEQKHLFKVANLKELCGKLPKSGEMFFLYTTIGFNAITFILLILEKHMFIEKLSFSTYSISKSVITLINKLIDNRQIGEVDIYISESFQIRSADKIEMLQVSATTRPINIHYGVNHSKISCIRTDNDYYVVEGSGNFSENALNEQYLFINDQEIYEFRYNCISC